MNKIQCYWCGKTNRTASDYEQDQLVGNKGWHRLCVRCANKRLKNPYSVAKLRKVEPAGKEGA